jgi:hypothetical protein
MRIQQYEKERDCVIEDVGPEWAAVCSCVVVEMACMFRVCLYNDSVINIMTLSLAEKDVLYSMAAAGSAENFDANIPNYTASHSGNRTQNYPTTAWRCSDCTFYVLCTFLCDHIAVHQTLILCSFVLRLFALTPP